MHTAAFVLSCERANPFSHDECEHGEVLGGCIENSNAIIFFHLFVSRMKSILYACVMKNASVPSSRLKLRCHSIRSWTRPRISWSLVGMPQSLQTDDDMGKATYSRL